MQERIQKILSARGVASRRQAEEMIFAGRVSCNGVISNLGDRADPDVDTICLDGKPIPSKDKTLYILLNKPRGYVTTLSDEKGRKNVAQLVSGCNRRVYPIGRLDMDSEGLLLLTNDGEFANMLMHPRHQVDKTYQVWVTGYSAQALELVKKPITLDGYTIAPPEVSVLRRDYRFPDRAELSITIHEGRNRQVRRMCQRAGMQVTRLMRIREGNLTLGELPVGIWRYLTDQEVADLKQSFKCED